MIRVLAAICALLAAFAVAAEPVSHWRTANGVPVYFAHAPELPMADIRMVFRAGSARDADLPGLGYLTARLLTDAAGERTDRQVQLALARTGARLFSGSDRDTAWLQLRSLTADDALAQALPLLAAAAAAPAFTDAAVARERAAQIAAIRARRQQAGNRAADAFHASLFAGHPYAQPVRGDADSVAQLSPGAVRRFHQRWFVAGNALIAIVGDLTEQQARQVSETLAAGLPPGDPPAIVPAQPSASAASAHVQADTSQTHIVLGHEGLDYLHPDYDALYLANHILGGGILVSRLFTEIRERRGLAYGAGSVIDPLLAGSVFRATLATRADQAAEALALARSTIAGFVESGPEEAELERARANLVGGFPLRIDSNAKKLEYLTRIGLHGLPLDYLDTFPARMQAVTADQVRAALRRHLHPERLLVLTLGPASPAGAAP